MFSFNFLRRGEIVVKSKTKKKPKTIAYLRVSTIDQDTEKNKNEILNFNDSMGNFEKYVDDFLKIKYKIKLDKVDVLDDAGWKIISQELNL